MVALADQKILDIKGVQTPALGVGTWQMTGDECSRSVADGLVMGYRHIDTAQMYENEVDVGRGIAESGVERDEIFLTTKLSLHNVTAEAARRTTEESLTNLRTEYVDLLLIHWPSHDVPLEETLAAMQELREEGKTRRIGVSNFPPSLLKRAREQADIFCNQVEYHPFLSQNRLLRSVRDEGLLLTAYCPLARGKVMEDETIGGIARLYERSPAQIALRWLIQQDVAAIPKASNTDHLAANLDIFDFELSQEEMRRISQLGNEERLINPDWGPAWERM